MLRKSLLLSLMMLTACSDCAPKKPLGALSTVKIIAFSDAIPIPRCYETKEGVTVFAVATVQCPPKSAMELILDDTIKLTGTTDLRDHNLVLTDKLVACPVTMTDEFGCFDRVDVIVQKTDEWPKHMEHLFAHQVKLDKADEMSTLDPATFMIAADVAHLDCTYWWRVNGIVGDCLEPNGADL